MTGTVQSVAPADAITHAHGTAQSPGATKSMVKTILIVDDDPSIRFSLRKVLSGEGYETVLAANGQEAIDKYNTRRVDLVLLDLNLPENSGWDIFGTLTASDPCLPIVIITGRHDQRELAAAAGISALMEKPLNVSLLLLTIAELLEEPPVARLKRLVGHRHDLRHGPPCRENQPKLRPASRGMTRHTTSISPAKNH